MKKLVIILMAVLICPYIYAQTLTAEYFFDIDPGFGNAASVAVVENQAITLNLESLSALHTMYIRVQNQSGSWSLTNASSFIVLGQFTSPSITKVEYFFDIDPGFGNGTSVDLEETLVLNLESLSAGLHTAYIRVQDQNGSWSLSNAATFILLGQLTNPDIVRAEYFFDTDPGFGMATALSVTASNNMNEQYLLDVSALSVGDHLLIIRTQDKNGSWSITNTDTFTICTPPPNPTFEMDTVLVCTIAGVADKVTLTTSSTVSTPIYRWYDTALANKILLEENSTGIYDALNIDRDSTFYVSVVEGSCESELTAITIDIETNPTAPVISLVGNNKQLMSDVNGQLQWFLAGVAITNATNQTYEPSESGMYQVSITSSKGCETLSEIFDFSFITSINKELSDKVKVYPNPITNKFTIDYSDAFQDGKLKIYNVSGSEVYKATITQKSKSKLINTENFDKGLYFLHILTEKGLLIKKIIKQ